MKKNDGGTKPSQEEVEEQAQTKENLGKSKIGLSIAALAFNIMTF